MNVIGAVTALSFCAICLRPISTEQKPVRVPMPPLGDVLVDAWCFYNLPPPRAENATKAAREAIKRAALRPVPKGRMP